MADPIPDGGTDSQHFAATFLTGPADVSKEERDIACAAEVLESGLLSERQLTTAASSWSLHGTQSLQDFLLKSGTIGTAAHTDLCQRLEERLFKSRSAAIDQAASANPADSVTKSALERLDQSGRVARVLGISAAVSGVTGDEAREHSSRYELIRKLGQGGLGTVWLARDRTLRRYVALKEIRANQSTNPSALLRFQREAEITGRLEHPGIVPVYQLGEDAESGKPFYTMRFLGKQSLQDAIAEYHERRLDGDDSPMLLRNLLTAFVSVCQAVGHAHSRKVIHRDLKPENVAIDSFGQVIVIDWGLAKIMDDGVIDEAAASTCDTPLQGDDSDRTVAGQVLGSPLFMAPEQAAGRVDKINERTDVYGLGGILFAILTGEAPHEQSRLNAGSTTTRQLITTIASGPTPEALQANSAVDPALAAICRMAMAKKSYARYPTATALAEDVQRWMAGEPVAAFRETPSQQFSRWVQKHRRLTQLLASVLIMILVAAITIAVSSNQNRTAASQTQFEQLRADGREVELQVRRMAEELSKDVRFMSALPPIQGIILARNKVEDNSENSESEDVWHERLETIYEGLLRANPEYLRVTFVGLEETGCQEIVRVERHASEQGFIRRVPRSRLAAFPSTEFLAGVLQLEPGDVRQSLTSDGTAELIRGATRRLAGYITVYDEFSGDAFGYVVIEVNLSQQITDILDGLGERQGSLYVTGPDAAIWFISRPGTGVAEVHDGKLITSVVPELTSWFASTSDEEQLSGDYATSARRLKLDPISADCRLGLILTRNETP